MSHTWITRWENKVKKTLSCIKSLFYEITGDLNSTSHGSGSNPVHATIHTDIHIYIQTDIHTHIHTYIRLQCLLGTYFTALPSRTTGLVKIIIHSIWYNLNGDSNYSNVFVVHRNIGYQSSTFAIILSIIHNSFVVV